MESTSSMSGTLLQHRAPLGEQAGHHQLEGRVLGSSRPDGPAQRAVGSDHDLLHGLKYRSLGGHRSGPFAMADQLGSGPWQPNRKPRTATWPWNWSGPPKQPPWRPVAGWAGATSSAPTAPPWKPCGWCSPRCRWTASSSSARARRTTPPCSSTASGSATGRPRSTDIAVDPIDGTTPTALGRGGALAVIAVSERGTMFDPGPCVYMEKLAVGPRAKGACDIRRIAHREPPRPLRGPRPPGARPDRGHPRSTPPRSPHRRGAHGRAPASG